MKTWKVDPVSKDFVVQGGSPLLIDGENKLEQDIRWHIIYRRGYDQYNPSLGTGIQSLVGSTHDMSTIQSMVSMDVIDALRQYHRMVLNDMSKAQQTFTEDAFSELLASSAGEMISEIVDISVDLSSFTERSMRFMISIRTDAGTELATQGVISG